MFAATFTADPIADVVSFLLEQLELPVHTTVAQYNQIFQELLDPASALHRNRNGANVILLRLEDWMKGGAAPELVREDVKRFVEAVRLCVSQTQASFLVLLCPGSPVFTGNNERSSLSSELEALISHELAPERGVEVWTSEALLDRNGVTGFHDAESEALGHIPYSQEFMALLGTVIARRLHAMHRNPYKVVVLDCDHTLWNGACSESKPEDIEVDSGRAFLQEFMVAQREAGMLLCLCSRNRLEDVQAMFRSGMNMALKEEHILAVRVGWGPKSEAISSLARELSLDPSSFIFLDDSPVECAEVRAACPEVLTLQLPSDPEQIPVFVKNVWAFDRVETTEEDRGRTDFYRRELQRADVQAHSASLEDFLNSLDLQVSVRPIDHEMVTRVAQLTKRTNQFNLNGARHSEPEIASMQRSPDRVCLAVTAKDRFGDYGLVGAAVCKHSGNELSVDGLWMSCRVLGRGIESKLISEIGAIASARSLASVSIPYRDTGRNEPIRTFLEQIGSLPDHVNGVTRFDYPAGVLAGHKPSFACQSVTAEDRSNSSPRKLHRSPASSNTIERIATEWADSARLMREVRVRRRARNTSTAGLKRTDIEGAICGIWAEVLGENHVNRQDDFFALGGDSLLAVQMLALINRKFNTEIQMDVFFESGFTVADLAITVEHSLASPVKAEAAGA